MGKINKILVNNQTKSEEIALPSEKWPNTIITVRGDSHFRDVAAETFVLLKNEGNLLPLKKEGKIALIGPLADTRNNIAGTWSVAQAPDKYATIKEAMEKALRGKATLLYTQGSNIWRNRELQKNGEFDKPLNWGDEAKMKAEALQVAKDADVIVCAMGESADMSGEYASNCLDVSNGPLYPFGYGLSYTTFDYSNFKLNSQEAGINGNQETTEWQDGKKITATITVKNTGARDADEVVQLYIRDLVASISRPIKELKGFQRIHLAAGESKEVSFDITPDMLKFYNAELKHVIEPGYFQIMMGTNSKEVKTLKFRVN